MKVDIEKRQYWEGQIEAWMASGLTQRTFCEREQLKRPTFDYWRRRIKTDMPPESRPEQRKTAPPMTLVPVQVASAAEVASLALHSPGGWRLTLPSSVDAAWLAALMQALA